MTAPPVLRVSALTKSFFGTAAVDELYLDVHEGEIVALIGPSGCGKSTLLRCLTWLEQPDDGFIEVTGKPFGRELTSGGVVRRHGRREIDALRPKIEYFNTSYPGAPIPVDTTKHDSLSTVQPIPRVDSMRKPVEY